MAKALAMQQSSALHSLVADMTRCSSVPAATLMDAVTFMGVNLKFTTFPARGRLRGIVRTMHDWSMDKK
jgi:hypothetical protein